MAAAGELRALATAAVALAIGAACYPLLRPALGLNAVTGALPAALHAFAFAVAFAVTLRPWPAARNATLIAWAGVLAGFECLQLAGAGAPVAAALAAVAPQAADAAAGTAVDAAAGAVGRLLAAHLAGTFDPLDVLASLAGCAAAAALVQPPEGHERPTFARD